jgi:hypothetical protein
MEGIMNLDTARATLNSKPSKNLVEITAYEAVVMFVVALFLIEVL